jgi:hypothetical protein
MSRWDALQTLGGKMDVIERKYGITRTKLSLLHMASTWWRDGRDVRTMDLMKVVGTKSPATTHREIQELIEAKMFNVVVGRTDKRERWLAPGIRIKTLIKDLEK